MEGLTRKVMDMSASWAPFLCLLIGFYNTVDGLECYSCPPEEVCLGRFPQWPGRCHTGDGGKCFIRKDPSGRQYWGCVDKNRWPQASTIPNGCWAVPQNTYIGKVVTLCFCDWENCNDNITQVLKHYISYPTYHRGAPHYYGGEHYNLHSHGIQNDAVRSSLSGSKYVHHYSPLDRRTRKRQYSYRSRYSNVNVDRLHEDLVNAEDSKTSMTTKAPSSLQASHLMRKPEGKSAKTQTYQDQTRDCRFSNGGCAHVCTPGQNTWYGTCSCKRGYELGGDEGSCQDLDECATEDNGGCELNCVNTPGSFHCACPVGYRTSQAGRKCIEMDECNEGTSGCSHQCLNTRGSFQCLCPLGMELHGDGRSCRDLNECMAGIAKCEQLCNNTVGSYSCLCRAGYTRNVDGWSCDDVNECDEENGGCAQKCINSRGSFSCACEVGLALDADETNCVDENECLWTNGGCAHYCNNSYGSFVCSCAPGYELNADRKTCDELHKDSKCYVDNGQCQHVCTTLDQATGRMQCSCNPGYMISTDQKTCVDINECRDNVDGCEQLCENTEGSYKCACSPGYRLDTDSLHCIDDNECGFENGGCNHMCTNERGTRTCSCHAGYVLNDDDTSCDDINECMMGDHKCLGECVNVMGSYHCGCPTGRTLNADHKSCDDINECLISNGGCEHKCVNTEGSFYCGCKAGFTIDFDNRTCYDFNECRLKNGHCEQICENTHGSYRCRCERGYEMNLDGHSCNDIDECSTGQNGCAEQCQNLPGTYQCGCRRGYKVAADRMNCEDDDECLKDNGGCSHNCTNTEGSYVCTCTSMYTMAPDLMSCIPKCPTGFMKLKGQESCYRVQSGFTPRSHAGGEGYCRALHHMAHLATVDTKEEREALAKYLETITDATKSMRGWWVGAKYLETQGQFIWTHTFTSIPLNHENWGVRKQPYENTCVLLIHGSSYANTLSNVDCSQLSAFICEIELPNK